jgi:hypothetical protein
MMQDNSDVTANVPPAPLPLSFNQLRIVTQDELTRRMASVKGLREGEGELYQLLKDTETGEHYLHYAVFHLNLAGGGAEEEYHHLLPLEHDDVIALALGAPLFEYPLQWNRAYLRNGPDGGFVWYDPSGAANDEREYAEIEAYIRERLLAFRRSGDKGEEEVKRLLEEIDRSLPQRREDS